LDCHARRVNNEMLFSGARAIASVVGEEELREDYIIPSVFNRKVQERVSHEVREAALRTGEARMGEPYVTTHRSRWSW